MAEHPGSGVEDDLDAFMDDLEAAAAEERGAAPAVVELDTPVGGSGLSAVVAEFVPLNRRRFRGDQPLSPAESERWSELREILEYHFGSANPPLGGSRRSALRVPTDLKARTPDLGGAVCNLHNLSEGGGFFETPALPEVGTTLTVEIDPGDGRAPMRLEAVVRWGRELPNMTGPAGVGVEFSGLEDDDVATLRSVVEAQLVAAGRREA